MYNQSPAAKAASRTSKPLQSPLNNSQRKRHAPPRLFRVQLPDSPQSTVVQYGRRSGRPILNRIQRVRATRALPAENSEDKPTVVKRDIWEEEALSHNSGLQLLFLGTGRGHPAEQRYSSPDPQVSVHMLMPFILNPCMHNVITCTCRSLHH